jgi:UDP-3-O-[3-hydroxymyristoyl] glucosamine N-acyltransferase
MRMKIKIEDLARFLKTREERIVRILNRDIMESRDFFIPGPADAEVRNLIAFVGRTARSPGDLISQSKAAVLFVDETARFDSEKTNSTLVVTGNARLLFCELLNSLIEKHRKREDGVGTSRVHETAAIGGGTSIGNGCDIGENVRIGRNCTIRHNVTIFRDVEIGNGVIVDPGVVIGGDGFSFEKDENGAMVRFPHMGTVVIEDDVEIGANCVIDRGTFGETRIRRGVKIDNLVHIAHNVEIGENSVVIANAMIGGGTKVGAGSWIGPSASLLDRIRVGAGSFVGMGVSVVNDLAEGAKYTWRHFLGRFREK